MNCYQKIVVTILVYFTLCNKAMEHSSILCHGDLIPQITEHLCVSHKYQYCSGGEYNQLKGDLIALSTANRFLRDYYAQEKNAQKIVRWCSLYFNSSDLIVAEELKYNAIAQKISRLFTFCNKPRLEIETDLFTKEDLEDSWYLDSTDHCRESLLYKTINAFEFEKAQLIIDHTPVLDLSYDGRKDILQLIISLRNQYRHFREFPATLLSIAKQLLEKGLSVHRITGKGYIPLVTVASYGDKDLARLLLAHGADPYVKQYGMYTNKCGNAFEEETGEPKGWLRVMVAEIAANKKL